MGSLNIIPQASIRDSFGFTPPVAGLDHWNYHIGAPYLPRNLIRGGAAASQMGAPEFLTGFTRYEGLTDGVQTDITLAPGGAITLCGVIKTPDAAPDTNVPVFFGTWNSGSPAAGFYLGARSTGIRLYTVLDNGGAASNAIIDRTADETAWRFIAATIDNRVSGTTTLRIVDKTAGTETSQSFGFDLMPCARQLRIGKGHFLTNSGVTDIAMDAIKAGMLTDAEITAIYERAKLSCALDSITV